MMETRTREKRTGYHGLRGSVGTLDDTNPTRLSKQYHSSPLTENGWHPRIPICSTQLREREENIKQRDGEERARSQVVSDRYYYAYHLHVRDGPQPPLFYGGKLFQQFVVDT